MRGESGYQSIVCIPLIAYLALLSQLLLLAGGQDLLLRVAVLVGRWRASRQIFVLDRRLEDGLRPELLALTSGLNEAKCAILSLGHTV